MHDALDTANYIRNLCPTTALNGEIPCTMWKGKKPTVKYMNVFGAKVYYKEKEIGKGKFDSVSIWNSNPTSWNFHGI